MNILITSIHITACFILILIVLLQTGKGADMGTSFGAGASQTLFGSSGATTILSKVTTGVAIIFILTSLTLAYFSIHSSSKSIILDTKQTIEAKTQKTPPSNKSK